MSEQDESSQQYSSKPEIQTPLNTEREEISDSNENHDSTSGNLTSLGDNEDGVDLHRCQKPIKRLRPNWKWFKSNKSSLLNLDRYLKQPVMADSWTGVAAQLKSPYYPQDLKLDAGDEDESTP